ncbi:MAG: NAD+ synthase [Gammaproteobacteria bacterium]
MKIISAQLNYTIGDFEQNTRKILDVISKEGQSVDLIIFSELCLSGYYPLDLIDRAEFIEAQNRSLRSILECSRDVSAAIIIGVIDDNLGPGKPHFNGLFVIQAGEIVLKYHKKLLPVYNIFNEARHFEAGRQAGILVLNGKRIGLLICEDGWGGAVNTPYQSDPVSELESQNLDLVVSINGSPSNLGKAAERQMHFSSIAKRCKAPLVFVNQVGGNDDIVFDGGSFALDFEGRSLGQLPFFEEATGCLELNSALVPVFGFRPSKAMTLPEFCYRQIRLGLRDYVRKCHVPGVVIGVSGGIDSAITLALAVDALGKDRVHGIFMPSEFSSKQSQDDALLLASNLGVTCSIHDIQSEFELAKVNFRNAFHQDPSDLTCQNIQARLRGRILMEYSNQTGFLLISTGNKSELSVGFTTLYGDLAGGFNIIGDLYKTEVYEVANFYNQMHGASLIPNSILERAPTPELAPNQTDQDSLPPYNQLDAVLKLFIEGDLLPNSERKACELIQSEMSDELIQSLRLKVDRAEFKRRQACPILRLQRRAFGGGRQFPIARGY